jgi:hypothetical protein
MISGAMLVLAIGLALDLYVVTLLVTGTPLVAATLAASMLVLFFALWMVYPRLAHHVRQTS